MLGFDDCTETGRQTDVWDTAAAPLHECSTGAIGPGDYFAKTLLPILPSSDTIGLVPCAIVDLGVRLLLTSVFDVLPLPRLFQVTAWAYFLWTFLLGPGLLLLAFTRRARRQPLRIYALQLVQLILWMLTCLVTMAVAALSGP